MKAWRIAAGAQIEGLKLGDEKPRTLGAHDVRVRAAAASLNFRDLMIVNGWYPLVGKDPIIPGSDASGEVAETGALGKPHHPNLFSLFLFCPAHSWRMP